MNVNKKEVDDDSRELEAGGGAKMFHECDEYASGEHVKCSVSEAVKRRGAISAV